MTKYLKNVTKKNPDRIIVAMIQDLLQTLYSGRGYRNFRPRGVPLGNYMAFIKATVPRFRHGKPSVDFSQLAELAKKAFSED
jgi:hypothetical protein